MRAFFACGVALLLALLVSQAALAQAWPNRPVRFLVPFAAGAGINDIMARLVGQHLGAGLGQPVVIENRAGAGGIAGTEAAAKAAPDGYTFLMTNVSLVTSAYLYSRLPYDPQKDFVPVTLVATSPLMLVVHPSIAASSVQELIALAKANPGRLNFGSGGVGSTPHLSVELFKSAAGIDAVHVPYKGGAPALNDLISGQLSFMIENVPGTMPFVKGGKLRALAITSAQRSLLEPALPTMAESGVRDYEVVGWQGLFGVAGTPPDIVVRLQAEVGKVLRLPEVRERLAALGAEPIGSTPAEFGAFVRAENARWGRIIREKGMRSD
ncbi:MAG: tripartite tricarboxylate transporter substrate binding protein [Betaproteobacteria bacterium]|nr:MAG: tripartite tricarboxylate transporter substrate binding protein [Betaproteobacteria bacterium]